MIEKILIQQLSNRYQTTVDNIVREYFQHLFLAQLYQEKRSEKLLFKGGTALRIVWQSPRFSEDLDFTGVNLKVREIEEILQETLAKMERSGIKTGIQESKETSGGYLAIFDFRTDAYRSRVQVEVSRREGKKIRGSAALIQTDLIPAYTLVHLEETALVGEKIRACLTRGKARDFYDLYFILRGRMAFQEVFARDKALKTGLVSAIRHGDKNFSHDLKQFLPVSQHLIIKGFPEVLIREIERNLPG